MAVSPRMYAQYLGNVGVNRKVGSGVDYRRRHRKQTAAKFANPNCMALLFLPPDHCLLVDMLFHWGRRWAVSCVCSVVWALRHYVH
jgi:hypothetical protein